MPLRMMGNIAAAMASTLQQAEDQPIPGRSIPSGPGRGSLRSVSVSAAPGARHANPPLDTATKVAPGQWWPGSHGNAEEFFLSGTGGQAKKATTSRARSPSNSPAGRGKSKSRSPSPVARRTRKSVSAKAAKQ